MQRTIRDASYNINSGDHTPRLLFPVRSCGLAILKLTKALTECQDDPQPDPVRSLRRASRHLQAQFTLLHLLQDQLTPVCTNRIRKLLKRVGRAAGRVRDLDAQAVLVATHASRELTANPDYHQMAIAKEAARLSKRLSKRRNAEALKLIRVLKNKGEDLTKALRDADDAMQNFEDHSFTAEDLNIRIRKWLRAAVLRLYEPQGKFSPRPPRIGGKGTEHMDLLVVERLHGLRKVAKTARYMVEVLSSNAAGIKQLISELKTIQKSGGEWHDWLLLERIAAQHSSERTALAKQYAKNRDAALADYVKILERQSWLQSAIRSRASGSRIEPKTVKAR